MEEYKAKSHAVKKMTRKGLVETDSREGTVTEKGARSRADPADDKPVSGAVSRRKKQMVQKGVRDGNGLDEGGGMIRVTSYVSTDEDIHEAENIYSALEEALNRQINNMESTHPGYDEYNYQIDEIGHNPYRLISYLTAKYGAASNPTLDSVGTSDVLVLNRNGEMSCYYIDKDRLVPIRNFIRSTNGGNVINIDTRDYEIEGKAGKWQSTDELILDGNFFYLMENQKYRGDAAAVILDTYGKIIADDVMHGFDEETKQKIRDSLKKPILEKK